MIRYDGEEIAAGMKLSHNADIMTCIFESITDYDNGDSLPGLFFTTAVYDSNNQYVGHTCTLPYTRTALTLGTMALSSMRTACS